MKRLILILTILSSCQKEELTPDYIIFGHFYGECVGEKCVQVYKLTDNSLYEDVNAIYPAFDKTYDGNFELLDTSLFEKVRNLKNRIPPGLITTKAGVIGQPDAGDWGGIYFEMSYKGKKTFWVIDKMESNIPEHLRPFLTEIEENIELINN